MSVRNIFLYNILPKKRIFIAFIGFLISSTIITGGAILMTSIVDSTTSYLGESEDILVIFNPLASTPYTSVLPLELAETIKTVFGVIDVSPEVMTAAVYKDKAVYFRGVDVNKFWEFTDVSYLEGLSLDEKDTFDVSIGVNFAERNNLDIGEYFTVYSTRTDSAIELRVKSIFISGTLLDDEIIAPLWIGQFFSFEDFNKVTHIRVKIDTNLVTKEQIREKIISEHSLSITLDTPDNLEVLNATIYIRSSKGTLIQQKNLVNTNSVNLDLPFGEYEIQAEIENIVSEPKRIILERDLIIPIFVNYIERKITFRVITDEDVPINNAKIYVQSMSAEEQVLGKKTYSLYTNSTGEASFITSNGSYIAEASYGVFRREFSFTTVEENYIEVILIDRHPSIQVRFPENQSLVIGYSLNVSIFATQGYSIYFYYDGNPGNIQEYYYASYGEIVPNQIVTPFDEGPHSLTVICYNIEYEKYGDKSKNYAETDVYFTISHNLPEKLSILNAMNGSHIPPSSILYLNSSVFFSHGLEYKWNSENWITLENNQIHAPSERGIHKLVLRGSTENQSKEWNYIFITTSSNEKLGIIGLQNKVIKNGDEIQIWYTIGATNLLYHWDSQADTPVPINGSIIAESLNEGNHTLYLSILLGSVWYFKNYEINIDNSPPNITLEYTNSSDLISGSTMNYGSNESLSMIRYAWDNLDFSNAYGLIYCPFSEGNHNLTIEAQDIAGNLVQKYYEYNIVNFTGSTPIDFYLAYDYHGTISKKFIDLQTISSVGFFEIQYNIIGVANFSGNIIESMRVFLYPGEYTLIIKYWIDPFNYEQRTWNFKISEGSNIPQLQTNQINSSYTGDIVVTFPYFDCNFTMDGNSPIYLSDGYYNFSSVLVSFPNSQVSHGHIIDTTPPEVIIISPKKGSNEIDVYLELVSDAVELSVQLDHSGPIETYQGLSLIDFNEAGKHTITLFLKDSFYNQKTLDYIIYVGKKYVNQQLLFQIQGSATLLPLSNFSVIVRSNFNTTVYEKNTNNEGFLDFKIFSGSYHVLFNYSTSQYDFVLNTNVGIEQKIFIGNSNVTISLTDYFADSPFINQYCIIRDVRGRRVMSLQTDNNGKFSTILATGDYTCYFAYHKNADPVSFQVFNPNQFISLKIPSHRNKVTFNFVYDNGSKVFNLPVVFSTLYDGDISTTTGFYSSVSLWISYGYVDLTFIDVNNNIITLRRAYEPGKEIITIIVTSETEDQWLKIPFKAYTGFDFVISLSLEYMDYYLRGSLLFTYTLVYAEILLILIVVVANMYSILQNVFVESKRESTILRMIGGTNLNVFYAIFSRIGLIALVAACMGYGIGGAILRFLASANQTVFFGHTFTPTSSWFIFLMNIMFIILIAFITSLIITRRKKKERSIVYSRR
jgi:ABC-type lipoprotein release transport system permease subunit